MSRDGRLSARFTASIAPMAFMAKLKSIYLDYGASAPIDPQAKRAVLKYMDLYGNASSIHSSGVEAKKVVENSRKSISKILNARPDEIVFTGSGTESDNLAILGTARANHKKGNHVVVLSIEHHAVLESCKQLEKEGFKVTKVRVKKNGIVDPQAILEAVHKGTTLISVMYANHEIGTIQPIAKISRLIRNLRSQQTSVHSKQPVFHTDACHAPGVLNLNVQELGVDLMTLNGSKIYGPKGVSCLYIRRGTPIEPIMYGGDQERGRRAGTHNTAAIAGFAKALEIAENKKKTEPKRLIRLRDYLISQILTKVPGSELNGDPHDRLPGNVNISFGNIDGSFRQSSSEASEMLMLMLDDKGINVSAGSACTVSSNEPSNTLEALGQKKASIRITLGRQTTRRELDTFVGHLIALVQKLRAL
jgi:cysteine desulfurase